MSSAYHRLLSGVAALSALCAPAFAQEATSPAVTDELVVTAQRRSESILDVPLAVSALSASTLENAGVTQTSDLGALVPNLSVNSAYGSTQPNFSLRGISVANEYNANQASPVGVYVDDAYLASRSSHGMQIFDLERVEVLRGPQGTLYGRNTTGGAINFLTKAPSLNGMNGSIAVGAGDHNSREAQGAFEATLSENVAGIRAAIDYKQSDGLIDNLSPGRDPNSADSLAGRVTLRLRPTDALDVRLKVYAGKDEGAQAAVHGIGVGANGVNPLSGYTRAGLDFFDVQQDEIGLNETEASGVLLRADLALNESWTLSSLTSYDKGSQQLGQDADGAPLQLLFISWGSDFKQFNQELRLSYDGEAIKLQGGVYYGEDEVETDNNFEFFQVAGSCNPATLAACTIRQRYKQTRDSAAIFAQGDYEFAERWTATLGVRYTRDGNEYADGNAYIGNENGVFIASTIPGGAAGQNDTLPARSEEESAVTGRFALSYETGGGHLLYASASRGYRSGAFNGGGYLAPAQIQYVSPEYVNAYEIGAKGRLFGGATRYASALFHYKYEDQQVQEVVGPVAFLRNAGQATVTGFELETNTRLTDDLSFDFSLGLLDTNYDQLTLSGNDLSGNELPFAPRVTSQIGLDWTVLHIGDGELRATANVAYASRSFFSPYNADFGNANLQQGANTKVNASLAYETGAFTLRAWGRNIFNEETYVYGLDLRSSFGYDFLVPGAPRTFGVSLGYKF